MTRLRLLMAAPVLCATAVPCMAGVYSATVIADDPLGYYRLGEASGGTALNSATGPSSNGANGSYGGSPSFSLASLVNSETNTAVGFNGSNAFVNIANSSYTSATDARTAELWFNADNVSRGNGLDKQVLWEEGGATRGFSMYIQNGELYYHAWNAANGDAETWGANDNQDANANGDGTARAITADIESNTTYHAVLVYDDVGNPQDGTLTGSLTAYLNGVEVGSFDDLGRVYVHGDGAGIGGVNATTLFHDGLRNATSPGNEFFDGIIDDVSIYGTALSEQDVINHYTQGTIPSPSAAIMGLVGVGALVCRRRRN